MKYTLALLTYGDAPTLSDCVHFLAKRIRPRPTSLLCVIDGPGRLPPIEPLGPWQIEQSAQQEGFCAATQRMWKLASQSKHPYVFYLENDFILLRQLDLQPLANVLDCNPMLGQMQLMRTAVNRKELSAGGLFESRPGEYKSRGDWLEQKSYVTTNPSLMRTSFLANNPFDEAVSDCEGIFGTKLVAAGYSFGVWGDGSPWVRHVGRRQGFGY